MHGATTPVVFPLKVMVVRCATLAGSIVAVISSLKISVGRSFTFR